MRAVSFFLLCVITLFGFEPYNYVDKHFKITDEKTLLKIYNSTISPYFYNHKLHFFTGKNGVKIAYKIFLVKHPKATIVISNGRTESMVKYQEFIYDLNQNGYSVYILDHRGQGYSGRMTQDAQMGYVDNFYNYVDDLKYFVDHIVKKQGKMVLFGHSMGGAIASLYVESYPQDFDALVLFSPMHQPNLILSSLSPVVCSVYAMGESEPQAYAPGTKDFDILTYAFKENDLTHSAMRFELMKEAYAKEPSIRIGGPSKQWVRESCKASKRSVEAASLIKVPVLLLRGEKDDVVTQKAQEQFCKNVGKNCHAYLIQGAFHELYIEDDEKRSRALSALFLFLSKI